MPKILFVFKASNAPISKAVDWFHKVISPGTYQCQLCQLTHHHFGSRALLKTWQKQIPYEVEFWYEDQWNEKHREEELPLIAILQTDQTAQIEIILTKEEIEKLTSLDELLSRVSEKIAL